MAQKKYIAVIGAGLAGIAAALSLEAAGHSVTMFEKSRGVGGRMSTRRSRDPAVPAWQCDHGAPSFVARTPEFVREVQTWRDEGSVAHWKPRGWSGESDAMCVGVPSMNALAQRLAKSLKQPVISSHTVDGLESRGAQWKVHTSEHGEYETLFDAVVLAIPSVQAVKLLASVHSDVTPLLVRARAARMHATWAMMCRFDAPIALDRDWIEVNTGALSLAVRDSTKPNRSHSETWALHASATWSDANVEARPEDVANTLLEAFVAVGGATPESYDVHRWRYSQAVRAADVSALKFATPFEWSQELALGVCGDWAAQSCGDFDCIDGVEAAWLSGRALASEILRTAQ